MDGGAGTRSPCRYPGVCSLCRGRILAWVPTGQWEWSLLTPGVWSHRAQATEWQGPWLSLAHSRFLRGWPGARVPEGRSEPFKETFLCLKKKREKERETRNTTHNKVSGLAGMHSYGRGWRGLLGAPRHQTLCPGVYCCPSDLSPQGGTVP